jgi:hypothetical protein
MNTVKEAAKLFIVKMNHERYFNYFWKVVK